MALSFLGTSFILIRAKNLGILELMKQDKTKQATELAFVFGGKINKVCCMAHKPLLCLKMGFMQRMDACGKVNLRC